MASSRILYLSLFIATFAVSWAAIFIKFSGAGPLATAFYRVILATAILAIPAWSPFHKAIRSLVRRDFILLALSGLALGLHFAVWITSLYYTTISNSTILVATQPIFILILESLSGKEKIETKVILGMLAALAGMALISGGDFNLGPKYLWGDFLALIGAFLAGIYLFIGRNLRARMDNLAYIFPVYAVAAMTLFIICLFFREPLTGFDSRTWLMFLLLALIPTVIGHSLYNWLLKYVPAHKVATTILGEPIGATILAIIFFNQIPGWWTIGGGILILSGIFIVLYRSNIKDLPES